MSTIQSLNQDNNPSTSSNSNGSVAFQNLPSFSKNEHVNISNITPGQFLSTSPSTTQPGTITDHPIPSYSAWFSLDSIHEIEKKAFPEFFSVSTSESDPSSSLGTSYSHTRNFIIQTWRSTGSPLVYTSITAVRRHLSMDVASILKIHSFLERWGLINWIPVS